MNKGNFLKENNYIVQDIKCCETCIHVEDALQTEGSYECGLCWGSVEPLGLCKKWKGGEERNDKDSHEALSTSGL